MSPFQTSPPASLTFWCLGGISQKQNSINRKTASLCSAFGFGNADLVAVAPNVFVPHCLLQGSAWTATRSRSLLGVSGRICTGQ